MALLPKVKLKALVTYPAVVNGGTGIEVTKQNGAVTVDLDYGEFGKVSVLPANPNLYSLIYDTVLQNYTLAPVSLFGSSGGTLADANVDGFTYGRNSAQWIKVLAASQATDYDTVALAAAATISSTVNHVRVAGYSAAGDLGNALYKRVGSAPIHPGKFQSADGAWWENAEPVLLPEMFGPIGTGSDAIAIQAAVDTSAITGRNRVYLSGSAYSPATTINVGGNSTIEGSSKLNCVVTFPSGAIGFVCQVNNQSVTFRHFTITAPSGVGIILGAAGAGNTESVIEDMRITICNVCIEAINCGALHVERNDFFQFTSAGIQISSPLNPDGGDCWILGNYFLNHSALAGLGIAIQHFSGGGWKILTNKILTCQYGYWGNLDIGNNAMSALLIQNNSIEGSAQTGIAITNQSTTLGALIHVTISDNQGGVSPGGGSFIGIPVNGTRSWIDVLSITGNLIRNISGNAAIAVDSTTNINISANLCTDGGTPVGPGIFLGSKCANGMVTSNTITNYATKIINSGTNITAANNGP